MSSWFSNLMGPWQCFTIRNLSEDCCSKIHTLGYSQLLYCTMMDKSFSPSESYSLHPYNGKLACCPKNVNSTTALGPWPWPCSWFYQWPWWGEKRSLSHPEMTQGWVGWLIGQTTESRQTSLDVLGWQAKLSCRKFNKDEYIVLCFLSENWFLKYKMWKSRFDSTLYGKRPEDLDWPQAQDEPPWDVAVLKLNLARLPWQKWFYSEEAEVSSGAGSSVQLPPEYYYLTFLSVC